MAIHFFLKWHNEGMVKRQRRFTILEEIDCKSNFVKSGAPSPQEKIARERVLRKPALPHTSCARQPITPTRTQQPPLRVTRSSIDPVFYSLGASPKWIFAPAWPFRLGFGYTDFLRNLLLYAPTVCLSAIFMTRWGRSIRGRSTPLQPRPRVSSLSRKPTSPWRNVVFKGGCGNTNRRTSCAARIA
jgi:hypothetical protein